MFKSIGSKILLAIGIALVGMSAIFIFVARMEINSISEEMLVEKARAITTQAENARNYVANMSDMGVFDENLLEEQFEELRQLPERRRIEELRNMGVYYTIPIIAGWRVGLENAEFANYTFRVPKFEPRNPDNTPTPFEADMLREATDRQLDEFFRINRDDNALHYMKPIVLDESCMVCHGTRADSIRGDGVDPLGFKMEGWRVGEIHGAYEVIADLGPIQAAVTRTVLQVIAVALVMLVAITLFMMKFINRTITQKINTVVDVLDSAADGDFSRRVDEGTSRDEISYLVRSINKTFDDLGNSFEKLNQSSIDVANHSSQLSETTAAMSEGATEQADAVAQVASAAEEMSSTVVEISRLISQSADQATEANDTAMEGRNVVSKAMHEISSVQAAAGELNDMVKRLNDSANEIGQIIQVIDEVSDQTNLLALNAAIEAARAGDHGRGFAVVADEVRKLAERTQHATKEIADKIKGIQGDATRTNDTMVHTQERVELANDLAGQASQALETIVNVVSSLNEQFQQVAAASEEQSATTSEIAHSIDNIKNVADETARGSEEAAQAIEDLSRLARDMNTVVNEFKYRKSSESAGALPAKSLRLKE
ncbi:methyl-accepting chemotaxis protein [Desulfurispira natronophila]|uniref:Methyl-accepting chemotaxis protein n=1 Tax=Desulfurispira natronophila TaxID=682562 RepID=A0A7W7Y672_9BACT|nr:methyl-accepting chemotaxis protein [Desulfurispira natronophila]MBB5022821.1 methyl-accepting chemotaxis protein [Desulfurispira natronophila]